MSPSRTSQLLAFSTALLLALPPGWSCPLLHGQLLAVFHPAGWQEESSDQGHSTETSSTSACSTATRSTPSCCHHRVVPKSASRCGGQDQLDASGRSEVTSSAGCHSDRLTPTCHTTLPDGPASDCCCLGAPPVGVVLPTSSVERCEPYGLVVHLKEDLSSISEGRGSWNESIRPPLTQSRQSLFCVWRC